jgi:Mrp family chromosome partitioning ATPase/capsular polysaccharide biosynthesis protein
MAPIEYLKTVRRRWKLIAALVIVALALVYWTSPEEVKRNYEATNVMLVESSAGRGAESSANPQVVALWSTVGEVPKRVADKIGWEGDPARLADKVTAEADRTLGTVSISATDRDPEQAVLIANTFADEVKAYLTEQDQQRRDAAAAAVDERTAELSARIDTLDTQIAANPANKATLQTQRDALARQLGNLFEATDEEPAVTYTTIEPATTGVEQERLPGTRSREQRLVLAAIVALVLGFGLAIALDRSDTRVRTRQAAEAHYGLPVLAEIPLFSLPSRRRHLIVADEPDSVKAEAYRTLRTAIMLYRKRDDAERLAAEGLAPARLPFGNGQKMPERSVIMVTSAGSGDGKTTTAANLAVAYAETGRSVLVLSCDLWRSGVARLFGVKLGRGVSEILASDDHGPLTDYIRDTSVPGVKLITGGLAIRRPGGRLLAEQALIDQARQLADVVIIDTAPILSASLTRELATMVDAVVVVCRVGRTTAGEAERCGDLLDQLTAPALGIALVGVAAGPLSDYFSYVSPRRSRKEVARAQAADAAEAEAAGTGAAEPGQGPEPVEVVDVDQVVETREAAGGGFPGGNGDGSAHGPAADISASENPPSEDRVPGERKDTPSTET